MKILLSFFLFFTFSFSIDPISLGTPSFAKKKKTIVKYLSLSVGVYHDVSIPLAPSKISLDGSKFRKLLKVRYNRREKKLRLIPKREGVGTLLITNPATGDVVYEFRIDVKKTDLYKVKREIKELLKEIEGITIKIANNKVVVDGQILLPKDMNRILSVVRQYGDLATTFVTLSPVAQVKIAQYIERAIGNPEVTCRAVNGRFILKGYVNTPEEKKEAEIIARAYVPDVIVNEAEALGKIKKVGKKSFVVNLIQVRAAPPPAPSKIIQINVHFVELKKDYIKSFRFQWRPELGNETQVRFTNEGAGGVVSQITGTISNLLPKLNWAKTHGHARVLQSSTIIVEDGQEGVIKSYTKVPYQTVNADGNASTSFVNVGIETSVTPKIIGARSNSIKLKLQFSVSSLVSNVGAPVTNNRDIKTQIIVRSGMSAAVGGLISSGQITDYNRLPANAGKNPLFSLYASKEFNRNQSQFVVFVTPVIKTSASAGSERIKRKFRIQN
ncbi:MAG: BON domain-containing protein [Bdellovibrio sp.]|nr:MAG: BON domain-containing protein [Bdellovibrio sp.]